MAGVSGQAIQAQIYPELAALAGFPRGGIDYRMIMRRMRQHSVCGVLGFAIILAACAGDRTGLDREPAIVAVPVHPIAGLVDALAPEGTVEVVVLVPPGANPATHEPSIQTLRRMAVARVYFEIGHPAFLFEKTWLNGALDGSPAIRVPLFEDCPMIEDDPHVWVSPGCLATAAAVAASALASILPAHSEAIAGNLDRFTSQIEEVRDSTERRLAPHRGRVFFVLHPAWGYLAHDNDLRQIGILSHGAGDPGAARIADLIRLGRAQGVRTVFVQPQFNLAPAILIAEELGAIVLPLDPLARDPLFVIENATSALVTEFERRSSE